jgi:hypothetical protein
MSRPYFNIDNIAYSGGTLSLSLTYFKLRNNSSSGPTFSIDGFSNSVVFTLNNSNATQGEYDFNTSKIGEELPYDLLQKNVGTLGTSSTTILTQPTISITYTGTVSTTTNLRVQILGTNVVNLTSVAALGGSTSTQFLSTTTFSFGSTNFTGTVSGNQLIFTAPVGSGNLYNGLTAVNIITQNGSSFATSSTSPGTFSGGLNSYTLVLNYLSLGPVNGGNEIYIWNI